MTRGRRRLPSKNGTHSGGLIKAVQMKLWTVLLRVSRSASPGNWYQTQSGHAEKLLRLSPRNTQDMPVFGSTSSGKPTGENGLLGIESR